MFSSKREKTDRSDDNRLLNGEKLSGHFGWNEKREVHVRVSIFFGGMSYIAFQFPTENSYVCWQMVNGLSVETNISS